MIQWLGLCHRNWYKHTFASLCSHQKHATSCVWSTVTPSRDQCVIKFARNMVECNKSVLYAGLCWEAQRRKPEANGCRHYHSRWVAFLLTHHHDLPFCIGISSFSKRPKSTRMASLLKVRFKVACLPKAQGGGITCRNKDHSRRRSRCKKTVKWPRLWDCFCCQFWLCTTKLSPYDRLELFSSSPNAVLDYSGLSGEEAKEKPFIASMGIYVFKKEQLVKLLKEDYVKSNDFGGEIIPSAARDGSKVVAYLFNDYWEDIGTIKSFFEANLALAQQVSFPLNHTERSLYTVRPW